MKTFLANLIPYLDLKIFSSFRYSFWAFGKVLGMIWEGFGKIFLMICVDLFNVGMFGFQCLNGPPVLVKERLPFLCKIVLDDSNYINIAEKISLKGLNDIKFIEITKETKETFYGPNCNI